MINYVIKSREGKEVTYGIGSPDDPTVRLISNMGKMFQLTPEQILNKCFGHFSHYRLLWDMDPGQFHDILMGFWSGYLTCLEEQHNPIEDEMEVSE